MNPFEQNWNMILDGMVFNPESKLYSSWIQFLSIISLIQSFFYTHYMAFGLQEEQRGFWMLIIILCEVIYLSSIFIETLKGYD